MRGQLIAAIVVEALNGCVLDSAVLRWSMPLGQAWLGFVSRCWIPFASWIGSKVSGRPSPSLSSSGAAIRTGRYR